jgi:hypothetical protein
LQQVWTALVKVKSVKIGIIVGWCEYLARSIAWT